MLVLGAAGAFADIAYWDLFLYVSVLIVFAGFILGQGSGADKVQQLSAVFVHVS